MKTEAGLGWGEGREPQTQREGQSEMRPDPVRQLHWGPWRKSLSQPLISCLVLGGQGGWLGRQSPSSSGLGASSGSSSSKYLSSSSRATMSRLSKSGLSSTAL